MCPLRNTHRCELARGVGSRLGLVGVHDRLNSPSGWSKGQRRARSRASKAYIGLELLTQQASLVEGAQGVAAGM